MKGAGIAVLSFAAGAAGWAGLFAILTWMVPTCPRSLGAFLMFIPGVLLSAAVADGFAQ